MLASTSDALSLAIPVAVAVIAAAASVFSVVWTQRKTRATNERITELNAQRQTEIAELNSRLQTKRDDEQAIRDYRFEALKRLYAEAEPLLFQALEFAEEARSRIESLARSARGGYLAPDGSGWLAAQGYYFKSTAYILLAPITSYKILQRRLTTIDLDLSPRLSTQYALLKLISLGFTHDFELAGFEGAALEYRPDDADPGEPGRDELLRERPETYWRQGLYRGIVEMIGEALIAPGDTPADGSRSKSLGEFFAALPDPESSLGRQAGEIDALFGGFHPLRRPVLWRVLVAQHRLYDVFLATKRSETGSPALEAPPEDVFASLDWRSAPDEASDEAVREPVLLADAYVRRLVASTVTTPRRSRAAP